MRPVRLTLVFAAMLALADDSGFPPRSKPSDYPAHESVRTAVIGASVVAPDQVRKMFSDGIAKGYIVVEVAVYPADGHSADIDLADFSLKVAGRAARAERPRDVSLPWSGGGSGPTIGDRGPSVDTDTGVAVAHGPDPWTGRPRTTVRTWEDVGVSNEPHRSDPAPRHPDQSALRSKIQDEALPEGATTKPVAGYLYFAQYGKKRKNDVVVLNYSKDQVAADLQFPK